MNCIRTHLVRLKGEAAGLVISPFRWKNKWRLAGLGLAAALVWLRCGPMPEALLNGTDAPSTVVVDRHGDVLYEALSADGTRLERIDPERLPPALVAATLAAEDRRFFSHVGIDPVALARAARRDLAERQIVEGGSTISQQVAKLLIQRAEGVGPRGIRAKLREMVLALRLEHRFTKQEILARYLTLASYGNQTSGAARASRLYFGVTPAMLTPAQAAFLAGLPQRPARFNPWRSVDAARRRQQTILRRMAAAGALPSDQLREALGERLALDQRHAPFLAPHFVEMALAASDGSRSPRLETTLDLQLQREVEGIIKNHRESLRAHGAGNVSVVVLDNARGEWIAWEGSGNYFDTEHGGAINGPLVPRQPGSALKPFTYALAFEEGRGPATVLPDVPSHFPTAEPGVLYSPRNYDGGYRGPLLARRALAGSENVPAVALAADLGVSSLLRFLSRAGLDSFDRNASYYGLGLTLGNAEVRLDQLTAAYAAFARGGAWRQPAFVRGQPTEERTLVSPRTAFWITDILSDPDARSFIFGRGGNLEFPFPVAVKTGTSQAYHDNWTVGYTHDVTVGVWVGNFNRAPLHDSSGVTGAGPIFHAVMLAAQHRVSGSIDSPNGAIVPRPDNVIEATICALSGMRANAWCPSRVKEWVRVEDEALPCWWHHQTDEGLLTTYPPEYRAWASTDPAMQLATLRPAARGSISPRASQVGPLETGLRIVNPPPGAIYSIDPTLRREFQALPLRVVTAQPTPVTWKINGKSVGTTASEKSLSWPLAVGRHEIEVEDGAGRRARTSFVVK
jgi:penicillin-binding protein 1C